MKPYLPYLIWLLPLPGLAQAQPAIAGQTYTAKRRETCAETNTGGCWETFFTRLRFTRDSVVVSEMLRAVCTSNGRGADTTYTNTAPRLRYACYFDARQRLVTIPSFSLSPLRLTANGLTSQRLSAESNTQVVFELDALAARP